MAGMNLKAFTLPFTLPITPLGTSGLVDSPPWYFGGEGIEVTFETDTDSLAQFLPEPLRLVKDRPWVNITMVDMLAVSNECMAYERPERTQYS